MRLGTVFNWDQYSGLVDIGIAGEESVRVTDVEHLSNYTPQLGDQVWCIINGPDMVILDRIGRRVYTNAFVPLIGGTGGTGTVGFLPDGEYGPYYYAQEGPSAFSNYGNYYFSDGFSSVGQTDFVVAGDVPDFTVSRAAIPRQLVGPSKTLLIGISAYIQPYAAGTSATWGTGLMCTQITPPPELERDYYYHANLWDSIVYTGDVTSGAQISRWSIWRFQDTGFHTIALAFAAVNCPASFAYIEVWAIPL